MTIHVTQAYIDGQPVQPFSFEVDIPVEVGK